MAKIIQEQRFNTGAQGDDVRFGHAVQQEDGVIIKEETTYVKLLTYLLTFIANIYSQSTVKPM